MIRCGRRFGEGLFRRAYQRAYQRSSARDPDRILRWELVRAVERLADRIPDERSGLVREANRLLGDRRFRAHS